MNAFQSALQSVLEWLACHKVCYRNITLDKRIAVAVLTYPVVHE